MNILSKTILTIGIAALAVDPVFSSIVSEPSAVESVNASVSESTSVSASETTAESTAEMRRPRIGLTFAGGGAKGAAHIGVLKVLEEVGIPIDYITGTSMGSIIGMLYSLGYSANQMDTIISSINWSVYMSDRINRRYTNSVQSEKQATYLMNLPFNTGNFSKKVSALEGQKELGSDGHENKESADEEMKKKSSFLKSLPGGFTTGSNLLNLFNCLSVGYQDSMDFNDLPIPYACVVSDVVSGQPKVLHSGRLPDAVRASMAIPGVFAPVRYGNDMMLVDGGLFNNFPVDVCQEMGADIVIGVEVTKDRGEVRPDAVQSLPELFTRLFDMMTRKGTAENQQRCTIYIHPDISGFGTLSFDSESVKAIMERGYMAANEQREMLEALKAQLDKFPKEEKRKVAPARNLSPFSETKVMVSSVDVEGMDEKLEKRMIAKAGIDFSREVSGKDLDKLVGIIYGTGAFKKINYYLTPQKDGSYALSLKTQPAEPHDLSFGFRFDTRDYASLLLHLGFGENNLTGWSGSTTWSLGTNLRGNVTCSYKPMIFPTLNLGANYHHYTNTITTEGLNFFSYTLDEGNVELYLSQFHSRSIQIEGGARIQKRTYSNMFVDDYFVESFIYTVFDNPETAEQIIKILDDDINRSSSAPLGVFVRLKFDNLDKEYFANRGIKFGAFGEWNFLELDKTAREDGLITPNLGSLQLNFESYVPIGKKLELIPQFYGRACLGGDRDDSHYQSYNNLIGGYIAGRYAPHQLPFVGINRTELCDHYATVFRADVRWNMAGKHYLTGMFNYSRCSSTIAEWFGGGLQRCTNNFGAGIEYAYNSLLGPIKLDVHWSDISQGYTDFWSKIGVYLSIGYDF